MSRGTVGGMKKVRKRDGFVIWVEVLNFIDIPRSWGAEMMRKAPPWTWDSKLWLPIVVSAVIDVVGR